MTEDAHPRLADANTELNSGVLGISLVSGQMLASQGGPGSGESVMWLGPLIAMCNGQTVCFTLHFYAFLVFPCCCKGTCVPDMSNFPVLFPDKLAEELGS
jgi:hypothetical protein